ncbi:hypothetical protein BCR34DRAFT_533475 [Clohesyomyces aquaticus]|uniref:Rhodopsin domain-containing protein n=1 Tax=Clohesyomyces aquaticus TaxID=1231657 RepID=A0A1Y1ZXP2_9PLEO|nr:hypothetical protein BCR34DRAFT_533475 [Clohesyomyces aquaticus]
MDPSSMAPGARHRFAPITADNISGYLWVTTVLCLIYSFLIILARWHIKWKLYGLDDHAATLATFFQLAAAIPTFVALSSGLGQAEHLLDASQLQAAGEAIFAAEILAVASLATAKASVAALMLRLFTRDLEITRKPWLLCNGTLIIIIAWGFGGIVALSVGCQPSGFLLGHCDDQLTRWRILVSVDIFIEILLVMLPVIFIWNIQMKRYIKFQVIIAFGLRFPVVAFAFVHLHFISDYDTGPNMSQTTISALVFLQIELFWALLSATIPTLKAFMKSFNSGFGMEIDLDGYGSVSGHGQSGRDDLRSYRMRPLRPNPRYSTVTSKISAKFRQTNDGGDTASTHSQLATSSIRPDNVRTETSIYHPASKNRGPSSVESDGGSQEMIIKREVQWTVWHEDGKPSPED